jgi:hypothetical protein
LTDELLTRPPHLKSDGSGYDWREYDRWLQKVYAMLRLVASTSPYNVPNQIDDIKSTYIIGAGTVKDSDLIAFDTTSGKKVKDSGVSAESIDLNAIAYAIALS